jgi:hypothetical protein
MLSVCQKDLQMAKRGRPTTEERERLAARLVRAKRLKPELGDPFLSYPGVQALMKHLHTNVCGATLALLVLSEGAFQDVSHDAEALWIGEYRQMATFLQLLATRQKNVSAVARAMGLTRMYVVRTLQHQALALVAKRFIYLAEQTDPVSVSNGVRGALQYETI